MHYLYPDDLIPVERIVLTRLENVKSVVGKLSPARRNKELSWHIVVSCVRRGWVLNCSCVSRRFLSYKEGKQLWQFPAPAAASPNLQRSASEQIVAGMLH